MTESISVFFEELTNYIPLRAVYCRNHDVAIESHYVGRNITRADESLPQLVCNKIIYDPETNVAYVYYDSTLDGDELVIVLPNPYRLDCFNDL